MGHRISERDDFEMALGEFLRVLPKELTIR
jgi:hypothetical protein